MSEMNGMNKILDVLTRAEQEPKFRRCIAYNILTRDADTQNNRPGNPDRAQTIFEQFDEMLTEVDLILKKEQLRPSLGEFAETMVTYIAEKGVSYFVDTAAIPGMEAK